MDWTSYLTANPDLQSYWSSLSPEDQATFQGNPALFAEWHWNNQGQTQGRPGGPEQYAQNDVLAEINSGPLARIARDNLDASNQNADFQNQSEQALNAGYFNDAGVLAAGNRADLEQTGADAYAGRENLFNQDYAAAQGLTDNEIAAWEQVAAIERTKNENMVKADFGISGQYGKAVRNLGELGEEYGANRALYEGGRRRDDYNQMASTRYAAYGDLARTREDAARGYGDATSQNLAQYYGGNQAASRAYWGQVNNNQSTYAGGMASNYQDWLNQRNRQSDMGFNAAQLAVNAGQVATNNINSSNQSAADAYANSQYQRADANANMWNNIGSTIGSAYGAWKQNSPKPSGGNSYGNGYMTGNAYG